MSNKYCFELKNKHLLRVGFLIAKMIKLLPWILWLICFWYCYRFCGRFVTSFMTDLWPILWLILYLNWVYDLVTDFVNNWTVYSILQNQSQIHSNIIFGKPMKWSKVYKLIFLTTHTWIQHQIPTTFDITSLPKVKDIYKSYLSVISNQNI